MKKSQRATSLYKSKESKKFIKKYIYYDSPKYKRKNYYDYNEDLKKKLSSSKKVEWGSLLWDYFWNLILKEVWRSL